MRKIFFLLPLFTLMLAIPQTRAESIQDPVLLKDISKKMEALFPQSRFVVEHVSPAEPELQILKTYRLLNIEISDEKLLAHRMMPRGGSLGVFAYNDKELIYVSNSREKLAQIFNKEGTLDDPKVTPMALAKFLADVMLDQNNHVLTGPGEILGDKWEGYKVDRGKFKKIKKLIMAPHWNLENNSKILSFVCLSGWMHRTDNIIRYDVKFDPRTYQFEIEKKLLQEKIFSSVPVIVY